MKNIYALPLAAVVAATTLTGCGQSKEEKTAEACGWVYSSMAADKVANSKSEALGHVKGTLLEKPFDDLYATKNPDEADALALLSKIGTICDSLDKSSKKPAKKETSEPAAATNPADSEFCSEFYKIEYTIKDAAGLAGMASKTTFYERILNLVNAGETVDQVVTYVDDLCEPYYTG